MSTKNYLSAEHLSGSKNFLAYNASRIFDTSTEWSLKSGIYSRLSEKFGPLVSTCLHTGSTPNIQYMPHESLTLAAALFVDAFNGD